MHLWLRHVIPFLFIQCSLSANICYLPNGETNKDVPCDANALFTQCCGTRSACLTNGLCALDATNDTGISYARGTCTDKSWASPLCPQQCQLNLDTPTNTSAYDFRAGGVQVWQCGSKGFGRDASFCCESEAEKQRCCSTETAVFTLLAASVGPSTSAASSTPTSSFVSSAKSSTVGPTGPTLADNAATNTPTTITSTSDRKTTNKKAVGIGAGVGGAVAACILAAIIFFLLRRHKRRHMPNTSEPHDDTVVSESKQPVEVWTQPVELPSQPQPVWELPASKASPRI